MPCLNSFVLSIPFKHTESFIQMLTILKLPHNFLGFFVITLIKLPKTLGENLLDPSYIPKAIKKCSA